jgi:hypothetical protein
VCKILRKPFIFKPHFGILGYYSKKIPKAAFLENVNGVLKEKAIEKLV